MIPLYKPYIIDVEKTYLKEAINTKWIFAKILFSWGIEMAVRK